MPARRPPRWRLGIGLMLLVLLLHGMLLDGWTARPPPGAGRGREAHPLRSVQVRSVAARPASPAPDPALTAPTAGRPAEPQAARPPGRPVQASIPAPAAESSALPSAPAVPPRPAAAAAPLATAEAPVSAAAGPEFTAPDPALPLPDSTEPPPVYPTRLPAPVQLRYTLLLNGESGEAVLDWRHDGQHYTLTLEVHGGRLQPLLEQRSQGGFDSAGLAPDRFTDRRRGRGQRAANFRRDIGRIGFSGPQIDYPAWPGAQDRLSWWAQLAAIQAAAAVAPVVPPPAITLFVVDARGAGDWWRWVPQGEAVLDTALGRVLTQHWRRDPEQVDRFDSQRTEVWLDATRGQWPVLLRSITLRSGEAFELRLSAEPGLPP
jgi:hypothetical protein